jgi:hypothetical protein
MFWCTCDTQLIKRPNNNPYSVDINNDGSIYVAGETWGHVLPGPGAPQTLEPLMPFVAAVLIFFVPGVVLVHVQAQVSYLGIMAQLVQTFRTNTQ